MWSAGHTETTTAPPAGVWVHYADPTGWPAWDPDTVEVTVDGPMAVGTRGRLRPRRGPATAFVFTEVEPPVSFTTVSRLPLATLTFTHRLVPDETGSRFTHGVTVTGLLAPLVGRLVGRRIAAGLPTAMRQLAALAEAPARR